LGLDVGMDAVLDAGLGGVLDAGLGGVLDAGGVAALLLAHAAMAMATTSAAPIDFSGRFMWVLRTSDWGRSW